MQASNRASAADVQRFTQGAEGGVHRDASPMSVEAPSKGSSTKEEEYAIFDCLQKAPHCYSQGTGLNAALAWDSETFIGQSRAGVVT